MIEFFGLPGVGKTTVARYLQQHHGYTNIQVTSRSALLWYNVLFLFAHPISWLKRLYYVFRYTSDTKVLYYKFMNVFLDNNARYIKARFTPKAVLDQGFTQAAVSSFDEKVDLATIKKYLNAVPQGHQLYFFTIPHEWKQRIEQRGHYARERYGSDYVQSWKEISRHNYDHMTTDTKIMSSMITIDTNQSVERICQKILQNSST